MECELGCPILWLASLFLFIMYSNTYLSVWNPSSPKNNRLVIELQTPLALMYITNDPTVAQIAEKNGVQRVWIDLETLGKEERQKNLNTVKSHHCIHDIEVISNVLTTSEVLVRVNPINPGSEEEINQVIAAGADMIMLPMWKTVEDVLRGDMSLLGPRPPLTYHPWPLEEYTEEQLHMFDVRPGFSGWAQVHGRKDVEWHHRIELNVWYVRHCRFSLDAKIFFMTIFKVLTNADNENVGETLKK